MANDPEIPSKYRFIKDGWGNRVNFQASFGLKMTPEDIDEGNRILEAFRQPDSDSEKPNWESKEINTGKNDNANRKYYLGFYE